MFLSRTASELPVRQYTKRPLLNIQSQLTCNETCELSSCPARVPVVCIHRKCALIFVLKTHKLPPHTFTPAGIEQKKIDEKTKTETREPALRTPW